jgi:hypothetical protein
LFRRFGGWRDRRKRKDSLVEDHADPTYGFDFLSPIDSITAVVVIAVSLAVFWWVALPLFLLLLDAVFLLVVVLVGIVLRVALRRPWLVDAVSEQRSFELPVTGWKRALRARDGIASAFTSSGPAAWPSLLLRRWD